MNSTSSFSSIWRANGLDRETSPLILHTVKGTSLYGVNGEALGVVSDDSVAMFNDAATAIQIMEQLQAVYQCRGDEMVGILFDPVSCWIMLVSSGTDYDNSVRSTTGLSINIVPVCTFEASPQDLYSILQTNPLASYPPLPADVDAGNNGYSSWVEFTVLS